MKTNLLVSAAFACAVTASLALGTPLTETTAVHTKPDAASPSITYLKAGTEPMPATSAVANTPAGWMAVELPGPFQGYVEKKDMTKGLDVKPGTPIRLAPQADGAVLAVAERGDKTTITGLRGRWAQISLEKQLVGYINVGGSPGYLPPIATAPATSAAAPAPATPEPMPPAAAPAPVSYGQAAPVVSSGDSSSVLPRQFAGKFVSTHKMFRPRRPYDWELDDNAGKRFAYLDISKLLLTEQIEKYIDHGVVVFGTPKPTADGKDIVIQIESLQLQLR